MKDVFLWALIMLVAPAIGSLFIPSVAEWFGAMLINHASGMRALYPGLRKAFRDYHEAKGPAVNFTDEAFMESCKDLGDRANLYQDRFLDKLINGTDRP